MEPTERWDNVYKEQSHNLNSSINITRVIKSRSMKWAEHVARI